MLTALLLPQPAAAGGQLARTVERSDGRVHFDLRFLDARGQARALSFALPAERYRAARDGLQPLTSAAVERRLSDPVARYAENSRETWRQGLRARMDVLAGTLPDGIRLDWSFEGEQLQWSLEGRVDRAELERHGRRIARQVKRASARLRQQQQAAVRRYAEQVRAEVLRELNYVRDPGLGGKVRPDYAALARDAAGLLRPLAKAVAAGAGSPDPRARTALALAFVQTIPYDRLRARGAADGTGFAVPAELLHANAGDCDSKATALAAVLRTLVPEVDTAIVLLPGHAVLAADLPAAPGDRTVRLDGRRLVLMEPAGPGRFPLGRVSADSRRLLNAGKRLSTVWITGGPEA
jgi:hypothetical protein